MGFPVIAALRSCPPDALASSLANDLQAPALALRPELGRALRATILSASTFPPCPLTISARAMSQ